MQHRLVYWLTALTLTLGVALLYLAAADRPFFAKLEGQSLSWRFQLRGPIAPGPETLLVTIDDRSLASLGRWPLPRRLLAEALQKVHALGAKVIVLDLLLVGEEDGEQNPAVLAETAAAIDGVVLPYAFEYDQAADQASMQPAPLPAAIRRTAYPLVRVSAEADVGSELQPSGGLLPTDDLLAATRPAQANVFLAADGELRHGFLALRYGDAYYPSLAVEAVRLFRGLEPEDLLLDLGRGLKIGDSFTPLDSQSRLVVNHYGPFDVFDRVSLLDVMTDAAPRDLFAGRIVLIGATALGAGDSFATAYSVTLPGLSYFAAIIDNLLHGRALRHNTETTYADLLAILAGGLLTAGLVLLVRPLLALLCGVALLILWGILSYLAFAWGQLWLNVTFPAIAILANLALVTVALTLGQQHLVARAGRREAALSRFVSPLVVRSLDHGAVAGSFDRIQAAAVLFVDLRDFTGLSEQMPPQEAMALLRGFHQRVEDATTAAGGTIDKFLGDGALLLFGIPDANDGDAKAALDCALQLHGEMVTWSAQLSGEGQAPLQIGIGLHHGLVSLGEVGGRKQSQVTVTGDTVNTASRLQALSHDLRAVIVASGDFVTRVRQHGGESLLESFRPLPPQEIRGRREKLEIWVLGSDAEAQT